jgi:hypothetical protein
MDKIQHRPEGDAREGETTGRGGKSLLKKEL